MSHALLLRLFLSRSFFSVHVALQYLKTYPDNIGITYYLTRRLREIDVYELRDVWGFLCHLLVSRPSKSRALECFVVEGAYKSTHIAMITLWFMQASLRDLASSSHKSPSFMICQRTLLKCHEIIFEDLPSTSSPYSTINAPFHTRFTRTKVKHHVVPALVGLGVVLAGAPGLPQLTEIMGEVAIEQGRIDDEGRPSRSLQPQDQQVAPGIPDVTTHDPREMHDDEIDEFESDPEQEISIVAEGTPSKNLVNVGDDFVDANRSKIDITTRSGAQTTPAPPLQLRSVQKLRLSFDPLDQPGSRSNSRPATPSQSSPSVITPRAITRANTLSDEENLLQGYDLQSQSHLLRSHYCRSEVQFLLSLENVSNRLLVVPKQARVSALRAELTALNHKLPAEVCMLMWCTSSDRSQDSAFVFQPHHRIVRIPPGESVVLNSAERAPYLLLIEILHGDLDFDPRKRGNKEILKRIVAKEAENKNASHDLSFDTASNVSHAPAVNPEVALHTDTTPEEVSIATVDPSVMLPPTSVLVQDEEMDLVEQLYGSDYSLRSQPIDLSESIMLALAPKNKDLDIAAWSRQGSDTPALSGEASLTPHRSTHSTSNNGRVLSLDEYSERMRTAAIMLTQLNANLVREPVTPLPAPGTSSQTPGSTSTRTGRLLGSNWLSNSNEQPKQRGPIHPSLTINSQDNSSSPGGQMRMKLQPAEAAAIRDRIMKEMLALEEERMARMREHRDRDNLVRFGEDSGTLKTPDDERIIRRELDKEDPSAAVFSESWAAKKSRIRHNSPYGHLASWDCVSVIVKTGDDLRQEQLAVLLIQEFDRIWREENVQCWVRYFRILITGGTSGIVETITDAVSIHSIKKAQYARRLTDVRLGHVTLLDHFKATYGDPSSAKFARAQRNFAKSLAGYSIVTYLLQIKDRHNGNILLDRDGHLIHIDFGFMLSNTPGNIGFEAAPFKLSTEYIEVLGGVDGLAFLEFRRLFREGFEASRKHCDRIITLVELMQKDSTLPCFAAFGEQTANQLRDRFQPRLTHSLVGEYVDRLIDSSLGSNWTRLYDSYQYYAQSIL